MVMLASREVRWFGLKTPDTEELLDGWIENNDPYDEDQTFLKGGIWETDTNRIDRYAVIPDAVDMGIKWREGQLQIKGRREDCGLQCFEGGAAGRVEQWLKWSYEGDETKARFLPWFDPPPNLQSGASPYGPRLVAVPKRRALRRIKVDGKGRSSEIISKGGFSDRGVNVELTWVTVMTREYWTLGFEAFPDDSAMSTAFTEVANNFLRSLEGVALDANNCDSYPSWLSRLDERGIIDRARIFRRA